MIILAKAPENPVNHRTENFPEQLAFLFCAPSRTAHGFVWHALAEANPYVYKLVNANQEVTNSLFHTFAPILIENFNAAT